VLHPAAIPLLGICFLVALHPLPVMTNLLVYALAFVFLGTYIIPALISLSLKSVGLIDSLHMNTAKDRRIPFVIAFVFYLFTAIYMRRFPLPAECSAFLMGAALSIGLLTLLLPYQKASAHMAGIGGMIGLIAHISSAYFVDLFSYWVAAVLAAGLLGSARLILLAHSKKELLSGFLCGLFGMLISLNWL
jgi:hypothetical protein